MDGTVSSQQAAQKNRKEVFGEIFNEGMQSRAKAEGIGLSEA